MTVSGSQKLPVTFRKLAPGTGGKQKPARKDMKKALSMKLVPITNRMELSTHHTSRTHVSAQAEVSVYRSRTHQHRARNDLFR